ncbi:ATP-binding cassette domain-containing protein [Caldisericum exile]|uniref:Molybdate ABC transporter ATP-binding protein n=1 Tax=Caldisericum exile (strain DSM 21853 / NBRC 104410 / AZM16c01) TaxID=511051 RepID=A0A7U6GDV2_CALEA|nr:ATP-binding cassette domain-containing protein [Caldisericum exile]BAL80576.1 putative molybdate ABC transporter ATP-binding protein [Caldisericum exile AZM16c01]
MLYIENLNVKIGNFYLKNINLKIFDEEYFIILGNSGAGKTALLETMAGRYFPSSGKIIFGSRDITRMTPKDREIGFVPQDYLLFPHLSVLENITLGKVPLDKKVIEFLNIEKLLERHPSTLSGGEKQRVALARALVKKPKLLLLDEPTSSLDTEIKKSVWDLLLLVKQQFKITVLHVTHDLSEAYYMSERIAIMRNGEIETVGVFSEIMKSKSEKVALAILKKGDIFEDFQMINNSLNRDANPLSYSLYIPYLHNERRFRGGD